MTCLQVRSLHELTASQIACHDYDGDTILCYGHIAKNLYDYPSLNPEWIFLEGSEDQQDGQCVRIFFGSNIMQNSIQKDSLIRLLNNSSHSDTCFVKGVFGLGTWPITPCDVVYPVIGVCQLEDIYFK